MILVWTNQIYRKILGLLQKYEYGVDLDEMKFYLNGNEIIGWKKTYYIIEGIIG